MDLEVTSGALATLMAEARRAHPLEACGILFGAGRVESANSCANVHPDPLRHFEIDPAALIAAHKAARTGAPPVTGYWHSHPTGASRPSARDRACAARDGKIWAIVAGAKVSFWRDEPGGFVPLPYRVVAD